MVAMMKKQTTTDGQSERRNRYDPLTERELRDSARILQKYAEQLVAAADEVKSMGLPGISVDGRNKLPDSINELATVLRRVKTSLYKEKLDRE